MSAQSWLDDNHRYLAASLHWLRLRLQQLAPAPAAAAPMPPTAAPAAAAVVPVAPAAPAARAPAAPSRAWFGQRPAASAASVLGATPNALAMPSLEVAPEIVPQIVLSAEPPPVDTSALARAAADRDAAARCDPPPALLLLAQRLHLSDFERDTLLLCAAPELDPAIGLLFAAAQAPAMRNAASGAPSFALAMHVFDDPSWDAMSPQRPLRHMRLVEIGTSGATPLAASALRADERIVNYLKGLNTLDERLASRVSPPASDAAPALAPSQQALVDKVLARLRSGAPDAAVPQVQLLGADAASKQAVARRVCDALDRHLYRLALDALPAARSETDVLARLWQRESVLLPVALYLDADALDGAGPELAATFQGFVAREPGLLFIGLREPAPGGAGAPLVVEVHKPTVREQSAAWQAALGSSLPADDGGRCAQLLAGQFDLNLDDIHHVAALALGTPGDAPLAEAAWDAACELTRPRLDALAQRIEPKARWDDLVLPAESRSQLQQIATQVRGRYRVFEEWGYAKKMTRGVGISALFAGESGTGKTMAAEVIANELRLHLYRIDLSAVVSKYIGETEKNLRRLFDAAEQGGAILFFDEADALFGKRSEVKDSHDRYANIEVNYLLQRMEAFAGLAILATNLKSALDPAFMRRLRFIVQFPYPGPAERQQMWRKVFPTEVPQQALDYDRLARFNLSGGNIHSIALNAAFAAAHGDSAVTQPLLLAAVRAELRKLDKPVNEAEFR